MNTDHADAISQLEDEVSQACARVESVLSNREVAEELRRIANEIEAEE